jgi:hypothetical protein
MQTYNFARDRSRPPGGSGPSNPYQARIARSLDEACDASGLTSAELSELFDDAIDVAIPASELEAWRRGDREFPAWVIPAISDVAGLEQRRGHWVRRRRGLARAKIPVALGVAGMVVAGLAWAMLSTDQTPNTASLTGAGSRAPAPAATTAPASTPTPTAAPATLHRSTPQPAATPIHSPTPSALVAGAEAPTGQTSPPVSAGSRATTASTPTPTPSAAPTPTPSPTSPAPTPGGLVGGLLGGLLGLLGL